MSHTVWISRDAGFRYPVSGTVPRLPTTPERITSSLMASVNDFNLKWMTGFPTASSPRLGFVVQFTTDRTWHSDIETVFFPDPLDRGIVSLEPVAWLAADLKDLVSDTNVVIGHRRSQPFYPELVIQIDSELMMVVSSTKTGIFTLLRVRRAYLGSVLRSHSVAAGGPGCDCLISNGTAVGESTCTCTTVHIAFHGATTPDHGLDTRIPVALSGNVQCAGSNPDEYGCNPTIPMYEYYNQIRSFQTASIQGGVTSTTLSIAACGGTASVCGLQGSACRCDSSGFVHGTEFGNFLKASNATVLSTGDPLAYPINLITSLSVAVSDSADVTRMSVASLADRLENNYIRLDNEILFVKEVGADNVINVIRAVLGTSRAAHSTNTKICTVLWPLQTVADLPDGKVGQYDTKFPGKHYSFRVAAVNRAGLSPFVYYGLKIYDVVPRKMACKGLTHRVIRSCLLPLPTRRAAPMTSLCSDTRATTPGSAPMEIILVGAGIEALDYTVYIGHTLPNGQVDFARSRICSGLQVLDKAGTRCAEYCQMIVTNQNSQVLLLASV